MMVGTWLKRVASVLLCPLVMAGGAGALELETVVVEADAAAEVPLYESTSSSAEEIDASEIPERIFTVEEVLDNLVGVDVDSTGGMGARKVLSIRGSTSKQVMVYVDGVPVSSSGSGVSGLASIPVGMIEKIHVYKGSSPGAFGAGAIGGVVHIQTFPEVLSNQVKASASYGSFGTHHEQVAGRYRLGEKGGLHLSAGHRASRNDYTYFEDRDTIRTDDDGERKRENADYRADEFLLGGGLGVGDGLRLKGKAAWSDSERGVPGSGTNVFQHTRLARENLHLMAGLEKPEVFSVVAWRDATERVFDDPEGESRLKVRQKTTSDMETLGLLTRGSLLLGDGLVAATAEVKEERYESKELYGEARQQLPSKRRYLGLGVEGDMPFFDERLWVQPRVHGVLAEDELLKTALRAGQQAEVSKDHSLGTWALGFRYTLTDALVSRFNAGVYTRLPEFDELFGDTGELASNAELEEEKSINVDAGLHWIHPSLPLTSDVSVFYRQVRDKIMLRSYGDYSVYENIGKAEIVGSEWLSTATVLKGFLDVKLAVTFQNALNKSDATAIRKERYYDKQLPYHPNVEVGASAICHLTAELDARCSVSHESESYRGPSNLASEEVAPKTIVDLGLTWRPVSRLTLSFDVENIGDEQAEDRMGYPKPGRALFATLTFRFP